MTNAGYLHSRWGEEFDAAYRQSRQHFGPGLTLEAVAGRIQDLLPAVTVTDLERLQDLYGEPDEPWTRQVAFFALFAMGYDPGDFGLTGADMGEGFTEQQLGFSLLRRW